MTGFIRLYGMQVGVVANNGILFSESSLKVRMGLNRGRMGLGWGIEEKSRHCMRGIALLSFVPTPLRPNCGLAD